MFLEQFVLDERFGTYMTAERLLLAMGQEMITIATLREIFVTLVTFEDGSQVSANMLI